MKNWNFKELHCFWAGLGMSRFPFRKMSGFDAVIKLLKEVPMRRNNSRSGEPGGWKEVKGVIF